MPTSTSGWWLEGRYGDVVVGFNGVAEIVDVAENIHHTSVAGGRDRVEFQRWWNWAMMIRIRGWGLVGKGRYSLTHDEQHDDC